MGYATESKAVTCQSDASLAIFSCAAAHDARRCSGRSRARACYALNADDALRRKIEPELRKVEVAASRGQLAGGHILHIEEALLAKPAQELWMGDVLQCMNFLAFVCGVTADWPITMPPWMGTAAAPTPLDSSRVSCMQP